MPLAPSRRPLASLGCVAKAQGELALAARLLAWIEASATQEGHLPEQVADDVQSPHMLRYRRRRWGTTATPLLWSHAMHLVRLDDLRSSAATRGGQLSRSG